MLRTAIEARRDERARSIELELLHRRDADLAESKANFDALKSELQSKLREHSEVGMLIAGVSEEGDLVTVNREEIRLRIAEIPMEADAERAAIRDRYDDLQPRAFPLAVTLLVPESQVARA